MISYGKGFGEKGAYLFAKVLIYCLKQSHQLPGDQPQHKRQMWYKQREEGKQGIQSHLSKLEALLEKERARRAKEIYILMRNENMKHCSASEVVHLHCWLILFFSCAKSRTGKYGILARNEVGQSGCERQQQESSAFRLLYLPIFHKK